MHFLRLLDQEGKIRLWDLSSPLRRPNKQEVGPWTAELESIELPKRDARDYNQPEIVDCLRADMLYCLRHVHPSPKIRDLSKHVNSAWDLSHYHSGWAHVVAMELSKDSSLVDFDFKTGVIGAVAQAE